MTPLPSPLTAEEALAVAIELDSHFASARRTASPGEVAAPATVALYDTASAAHAALGQQAGSAPEIEAEIGQVWLISFPGPIWHLLMPGSGFDPWAVRDGIHYFISARTGLLTGLTTGVRLPGLSVLFARDDDLYRANVAGDLVERLTENEALGWGMGADGDDWWMTARWLPPRVSPDGNWIAFSPDGRRMYLAGVGDPTVRALPLTGSQFYAWSPDSRWLVYATQNDDAERGQLNVYDLYDDRATPMLNEIVPDIKGLAWSPDGRRLAFGCCFEAEYSAAGDYLGASIGQLRVMDLVTGQIEIAGELRSTIAGGLERFCWTADNRIGQSVEEGAEWSAQCSTPSDGYWIAFSPDGQRRAYVNDATGLEPAGVRQLVVADAAAGELWRRDLPGDRWPLGWSPDGAYVLLDDTANHTPIWRLPADGTGELEVIVEDGHLLGVVNVWR